MGACEVRSPTLQARRDTFLTQGMKWMGQAAIFTGSRRSAAPRATSGLHGFSAVATEPRGGLSPYLDERVLYRTPPRGPALRAKSARRQCCMTPPAPPPPPAP